MLEYTALQFVPVVLLSRHDRLLHTSSLFLLCSSLVYHAQKYTTPALYYVDILNCMLYTMVCCYRSYEYEMWFNYSVLVYDIVMYFGFMKVYGWNPYIHASMHTLSSIVGVRCTDIFV